MTVVTTDRWRVQSWQRVDATRRTRVDTRSKARQVAGAQGGLRGAPSCGRRARIAHPGLQPDSPRPFMFPDAPAVGSRRQQLVSIHSFWDSGIRE